MPVAIGWLVYVGAATLLAWAAIRLTGMGASGAVNDVATAIENHIYVIVGIFAAIVLIWKLA